MRMLHPIVVIPSSHVPPYKRMERDEGWEGRLLSLINLSYGLLNLLRSQVPDRLHRCTLHGDEEYHRDATYAEDVSKLCFVIDINLIDIYLACVLLSCRL